VQINNISIHIMVQMVRVTAVCPLIYSTENTGFLVNLF